MLMPSVPQCKNRVAVSDIPEGSLIPLQEVLEEMVRLHQQFLTLLQREKGLMIEGEVNPLIRCLTEKEGVLGQLHQLEAKRQQAMLPIAKGVGVDAHMLTLKRLIPLVSEPYRSRLQSAHERLAALSASIVEINEINALLVERTLQQVTTLVGLVKYIAQPLSTYQATGMLKDYTASGKTIGRG